MRGHHADGGQPDGPAERRRAHGEPGFTKVGRAGAARHSRTTSSRRPAKPENGSDALPVAAMQRMFISDGPPCINDPKMISAASAVVLVIELRWSRRLATWGRSGTACSRTCRPSSRPEETASVRRGDSAHPRRREGHPDGGGDPRPVPARRCRPDRAARSPRPSASSRARDRRRPPELSWHHCVAEQRGDEVPGCAQRVVHEPARARPGSFSSATANQTWPSRGGRLPRADARAAARPRRGRRAASRAPSCRPTSRTSPSSARAGARAPEQSGGQIATVTTRRAWPPEGARARGSAARVKNRRRARARERAGQRARCGGGGGRRRGRCI